MVSAFGLTSSKKATKQLVQKTSSKQLAPHFREWVVAGENPGDDGAREGLGEVGAVHSYQSKGTWTEPLNYKHARSHFGIMAIAQ